jgi:hypothetical protein
MSMKQRKSAGGGAAAAKPNAEPAKAPSAASAANKSEAERYAKLIIGLSEKAPEKARPYIEKAAPIVGMAAVYIRIAIPHIVKFYGMVAEQVAKLPMGLIRALVGFCMCFFGGVFPGTIAAYEAWSLCGGKEAVASAKELYAEFEKVLEANKKDGEEDKDGDGKADIDSLDPKELVIHKTKLVLQTVDPSKVSKQLSLLYTGWIGVLATLKIKFAKTVTLGVAIGEKLYGPTEHYVQPIVVKLVEEEYQQWVPVVLKWICKAIAVSIAWWIQRIISAFHSSIKGGLIFGRELVHFMHEKGYVKFDIDDTYIDEGIGWGIAVIGLFTQFYFGFGVPFPLNIFFLPLNFVEAFIAWSVNS